METKHIVQQFELQRKRLVPGRAMEFKTAEEAKRRAERDAGRCLGVAAVSQRYDPVTDMMDDEPVVLAVYGRVPAELAEG